MKIKFSSHLALPLASASLVFFASSSVRAGQIWDGGGGDNNWNTAGNWDSDALPNFASPITFTGNTRNGAVNNLAADSTIGGINFTNTGAVGLTNAFTFSNNRITLGGDITTTASSSVITDNANIAMILNGTRTITTSTNHNLIVGGIVSETGGSQGLIKNGAGTLQFNSINTYSGTTAINAGTVEVRAGTAGGSAIWGSGPITLGQGATLFFNPTAQAIQNTGGFTVGGPITLSGGAGTANLRFAGNDNKFVLSGGVTGQAGVVQTLAISQGSLSPTNGDRLTTQITGAIANGLGGTLGVSVDFAGSSGVAQRSYANLSGANTFTGDLTVTNSRGLNGGGTHPGAWLTIGGLRHDGFSAPTLVSPGTGFLGAGADYSGNISVSNGTGGLTTLAFLTSANQILRGVISGTGSLHKGGGGTLTLTNANTFSGNTTVITGAGALILNNNLALQNSALVTTGGGTVTLGVGVTTPTFGGLSGATGNLATIISSGYSNVTNLTLNPQSGISVTFGGTLANGAANMTLTKTGAGTQTLAGSGITYTGNTTISAGTLVLSQTTGYASGTTTIGAGTLELTSTNTAVDNWRINTILAGSGTINKTGTGWVQTLTNANTFSGTFNIQQGAFGTSFLNSNWTGVSADFNISSGALLDARGQAITVGSLNGAGTVGTTWNTAATVTVGAGNKSGSFSGVIRGSGGAGVNDTANPSAGVLSLVKTGTGTQTLTGPNTYSGGTTISGGTIQANNSSALGTGSVSVAAGAKLHINANNLTIANNITLNGNTTNGAIYSGDRPAGNVTNLSGQITLNATSNMSSWWNDKTLQLSGQITGSGGLNFVQQTNSVGGRFLISGATNDYAGATSVTGDTGPRFGYTGQAMLYVGATNALPTTTDLTLNNADLYLNGHSQTLRSISGSGSFSVQNGSTTAATLSLGAGDTSSTFAGTIRNNGISVTNTSGTPAIVNGTVAFTKIGTGTLLFTGANTYSGDTTVSGGTLQFSGSGNVANTANVGIAAGAQIVASGTAVNVLGFGAGRTWNISGTFDSSGGGAQTLPGSVILNNGTLTGVSNGTFGTFLTNAAYTTTITANGTNNLISSGNFGMSNGSTLVLSTPLVGDALLVNSPLGTGAAQTGILNKTGLGTVTLTGTGSYTGATNVNQGTLIVNGNISTSTLTTVASGATLGGSGTVGRTVINGTLSVGNSPGTMVFTDALTLAGMTITEIDGTAGAGVVGGHDFVNLTGVGAAGVLTYGGTMTLDIGVIFEDGEYSWDLFDMESETGTFTAITLGDQYSGSLLDTDMDGIWDLNNGKITWQFTESTGVLSLSIIPEPSSALLSALGLLALLRRRR